jgi:hypothetical protein
MALNKKKIILLAAAPPSEWRDGVAKVDGVATLKGVQDLVINLLRVVLPLAGLAVAVMILVGGFQLITAGGEKEGISKAKDTFTYAIFGLALAIIAWFILLFVKDFTGVEVTEFNL